MGNLIGKDILSDGKSYRMGNFVGMDGKSYRMRNLISVNCRTHELSNRKYCSRLDSMIQTTTDPIPEKEDRNSKGFNYYMYYQMSPASMYSRC